LIFDIVFVVSSLGLLCIDYTTKSTKCQEVFCNAQEEKSPPSTRNTMRTRIKDKGLRK